MRSLIRRAFFEALEDTDALLLPVTPTPPFALGEKTDDPLAMYLNDIYSIPASLAGVPALSFPAGFTKSGLPIGLQLVGTPFDEAVLRQRIARDIRLAADLDLLVTDELGVAIGLDRVSMLGRVIGPTSMEYPFFGRGDEPMRIEPEDAFPMAALPRIADEVAGDLVSRLVLRLEARK